MNNNNNKIGSESETEKEQEEKTIHSSHASIAHFQLLFLRLR